MKYVLDLDRELDSITHVNLVEDLCEVTCHLDISFISDQELDLDSQPVLKYMSLDWRVLSGSKESNKQVSIYHCACYPVYIFDTVKDCIPDTTTLLTKLHVAGSTYAYSPIKFNTPTKGDTFASFLRNQQLFTFEEHPEDIRKSYCYSLTTQGFIASTWETLVRNRQQYEIDIQGAIPKMFPVMDANSQLLMHSVLPRPETIQSYQTRLFGKKFHLESNKYLSIGKSYSFDVENFGYKMSKSLLLIRQELRIGQEFPLPVFQLFAEVQNASGYN